MELRQLECFVRTAEIGSFTKAAELLHISQPALSKSIALLEGSLGVKLFDRHGKKVTLNAVGRGILEHGQEILNRRDSIYSVCQSAKRIDANQISLRIMAASELLPGILTGFKQLHPEVTVVARQNVGTMEQDDVEILIYASKKEHKYSTNRSVLCEPLALAVPRDHALYERNAVSIYELAEFPIVSLREGNDMRTLEDYYFELAGITPKREVECDIPSTQRALLKGGYGIALVPTITWPSIRTGDLRLIEIDDFSCVRYINVSIPNPQKTNQIIEAFCDYLAVYFSEIHDRSSSNVD